MSGTGNIPLTNPSPPVAPKATAGASAENWLALLGDTGPAARLLSVLEKLETSQANLTAADGGKAGLIRKTPMAVPGADAAQMTTLQVEITALRQENQVLHDRQQQAADRLAALLPSLAAHLQDQPPAPALEPFVTANGPLHDTREIAA